VRQSGYGSGAVAEMSYVCQRRAGGGLLTRMILFAMDKVKCVWVRYYSDEKVNAWSDK